MAVFVPPAGGWVRDLPDFRDHTPRHPAILETIGTLRSSRSSNWRNVTRVDLREYFPEVTGQLDMAATTAAHACVALIEYFERRAHGKISPLSTLYVYKSAQRLLKSTGNCATDLRTVIKAIIRFGIPPESLWPYQPERFHDTPDPFLQSFAGEYRSLVYARLDERNANGSVTLGTVKAFLAAGFPVVFGFPVPTSITRDSDISYRPALDSDRGGQAAVAVGYDDERIRTSKGALLIRNSWGEEWGEAGYGWLPYGYVEQQLAADFWVLFKSEWLESGEFRRPNLKQVKRDEKTDSSSPRRMPR